MDLKEQVSERFRKHIGKVIRQRRNKVNISREELAGAIGTDPSTLSRYENGKLDIKASTMAYISVLCNFPMYKYTEIYDKEPAAIVDDFKKLVAVSVPVKRRKNTNTSNIPPKPTLEFDRETWKWVVKETPSILQPDVPEICTNFISEGVSDDYFIEYIISQPERNKTLLLAQLADIVDTETDHGKKKCSKELKNLIRSSLKYIISDKDRGRAEMLMAYYNGLYEYYTKGKG